MSDPSVNADQTTDVDVRAEADGGLVVRPHGPLDAGSAMPFRRLLVHAVRKVRPPRLHVDLGEVGAIDAINLGTLAALCDLADDHRVAVRLVNPAPAVRADLLAAGVPRATIAYERATVSVETPEVASMS
jgi:anti-anti-sigma factor